MHNSKKQTGPKADNANQKNIYTIIIVGNICMLLYVMLHADLCACVIFFLYVPRVMFVQFSNELTITWYHVVSYQVACWAQKLVMKIWEYMRCWSLSLDLPGLMSIKSPIGVQGWHQRAQIQQIDMITRTRRTAAASAHAATRSASYDKHPNTFVKRYFTFDNNYQGQALDHQKSVSHQNREHFQWKQGTGDNRSKTHVRRVPTWKSHSVDVLFVNACMLHTHIHEG